MNNELTEEQKQKIEQEEHYRISVRKNLKKNENGKGCLIASGFLIGIFILISAISNNGEKKPSSTLTPIPIPAKQEKAEVTTEPLSKERIEFIEYGQKLMPINSKVIEYMGKRAEITSRWPNWDNNDVIEFAATGIGLELSYDEASKITPPKIMISVHKKWLKALEFYKQSVSIANEGIDNLDANLIKKSVDLLSKGAEWIDEATKEVGEINKKLNEQKVMK